MHDLDPDACAARRCRQPSEGTYYGIPLCDPHWERVCTLRPRLGAVQAIRNLLSQERQGQVIQRPPLEEQGTALDNLRHGTTSSAVG